MIETFILRHFDQTHETILEINSFNYVNDEVLFQYNDKEVLHLIVFYSKNMSFAECNYKIYDKELLTVRIMFKWVNQQKSELNNAWFLKITITEY